MGKWIWMKMTMKIITKCSESSEMGSASKCRGSTEMQRGRVRGGGGHDGAYLWFPSVGLGL